MITRAGRPSWLPAALCSLAALAGHAMVLGWPHGVMPRQAGLSANAATHPPVQISLKRIVETPTPSVSDTAARPSPEPEPAAQPGPQMPEPVASPEPQFADGLPQVRLPDAWMPPGGVRLRLFIRVDAEGRVQQISSAAYPSDASDGFLELSRRALGQSRLVAAGEDRQHCLQLDFRDDLPAPAWSWLPDTNAAQCLSSQAPTAKPLSAP